MTVKYDRPPTVKPCKGLAGRRNPKRERSSPDGGRGTPGMAAAFTLERALGRQARIAMIGGSFGAPEGSQAGFTSGLPIRKPCR